MSTKTLIAILISLFSGWNFLKDNNAGKTYNYNDGSVEVLNGHVKQIISYYERHIDNWVADTTTFDRDGNLIEEITSDIMLRHKIVFFYKYDKSGRRTEVTSTVYKSKAIYSYNNTGYTVKMVFDPNNRLGEYKIYKYNKQSRLLQMDHFFNSGLLFDISKYKYDNSGQLIQIEQRSRTGAIQLKETFTYPEVDSKNNWTTIKTHSEGFFSTASDVQTHVSKRVIIYY